MAQKNLKTFSSGLQIPKTPRGFFLFLWLRTRMLAASWNDLRRAGPKLWVIVFAWSFLLVGLYLLAKSGIDFIYKTTGVGPFLVDRIWFLFLFIVFMMLLASQLVSAYSTMVRSDETYSWVGLPVSSRWILRAKWFESSCYSAWAALILIIPFGLAYLSALSKPFWLLGFFIMGVIGLIGIATAFSTLVLLVWLRWIGNIPIKKGLVPVGFFIASVIVFWVLGEISQEQHRDAWFVALQELLPRMHIATSPLIPSGWAVKSLLASTAQRWYEGWIFIFLIWTTCLVLFRILDHAASRILLPVLRRQSPYSNRRASSSQSGGYFHASFWWKRPFIACVSKDVLLLVRDPMQWSQALVFFGLLGAYFANIHRISRLSVEPSWRMGVSSLNLVCTLLVFGSLAVRFLFPQMSLEGRRLWLTHIIPGGFKKLLMAKLVFYSAVAVIIVDSLLWMSASNLQVSFSMRLWLAGVGALAAVSLTGLTLGLGAKLIDLKAQDPARLVSSSSGAITLVLMLLYVGIVGFSLVLAWEADARGGASMFLAAMPAVLASFILGYLPIKVGMRSLERIEL